MSLLLCTRIQYSCFPPCTSAVCRWERKEQLLFPVWLPLGTLLANQIACLVDFAMQSIIVRVGDTRTHVQLSMAVAAVLGFSGCLSTVSTWVVELQKLALQRPEGYGRWLGIQRSLIYGLVSVTLAVAFGCIVYGTAVWTW
jgi:fluoride ion exporter CrcB/FEX